jgi:hypothetical protein
VARACPDQIEFHQIVLVYQQYRGERYSRSSSCGASEGGTKMADERAERLAGPKAERESLLLPVVPIPVTVLTSLSATLPRLPLPSVLPLSTNQDGRFPGLP